MTPMGPKTVTPLPQGNLGQKLRDKTTTSQAAQYLGLARQSIYNLHSRGKLRGRRVSPKKVLFLRTDLDRWLKENGVPQPRPPHLGVLAYLHGFLDQARKIAKTTDSVRFRTYLRGALGIVVGNILQEKATGSDPERLKMLQAVRDALASTLRHDDPKREITGLLEKIWKASPTLKSFAQWYERKP